MKIWFFTEQQYHPGWEKVVGSIRNTPPNDLVDPEVAADLIDRYYEEFAAMDDLGINIAVNEHHCTLQCMSAAPYLSVAALARTTKKAQLLSLGTPIAQRPDPVRVAEEIAFTDVMSRGRTEAGFVKSVPWEYFNSNANPVRLMDRFWEAHDLIKKTLTTHDGPFSWEGEFFHYRNVTIIPRSYQDPHPPFWITGSSASSAQAIAEKGYVAATLQMGRGAKAFCNGYRDRYLEVHGMPAGDDRLAYLCYLAIADSEPEARKIALRVHKWVEYLGDQNPAFLHAAGYAPAKEYARLLKKSRNSRPTSSIDELRDQGIMFWGTPDQVYDQIKHFYKHTGGIGHLLCQMGGYATQEDTISTMTLMAKEVLPRLNELSSDPSTKEL